MFSKRQTAGFRGVLLALRRSQQPQTDLCRQVISSERGVVPSTCGVVCPCIAVYPPYKKPRGKFEKVLKVSGCFCTRTTWMCCCSTHRLLMKDKLLHFLQETVNWTHKHFIMCPVALWSFGHYSELAVCSYNICGLLEYWHFGCCFFLLLHIVVKLFSHIISEMQIVNPNLFLVIFYFILFYLDVWLELYMFLSCCTF